MESRVLSSAAATTSSVTVIDKALPDSVIPSSIAISPSEIVAVITPVVLPSKSLNWATVKGSFTVIASLPKPELRPTSEAAYRVVIAAELDASILVIFEKSAATEVIVLTAFNSAAVAVISLTTTENLFSEALVALSTVIATKLATVVAEIVACIYVAFTLLSNEAWADVIAPVIMIGPDAL